MDIEQNQYKIITTWWNCFFLFWILNPGTTINELIFGQRAPKLTLVEKYKQAAPGKDLLPLPAKNKIASKSLFKNHSIFFLCLFIGENGVGFFAIAPCYDCKSRLVFTRK